MDRGGPGREYTFAAGRGPWSEAWAGTTEVVLPPWWGSWGFRTIVCLVIALTAWWFDFVCAN